LTLLNHPIIPLSTARAFAPTAVVSVLTEIRFNPPLTFVNYPYRIASSDLPTLLPTSFTSPLNPTLRRTNRESRMQTHSCTASAAPAASSKSPYRKCPGGRLRCPRDYTAPAHLR
jgi:hypothetical protein